GVVSVPDRIIVAGSPGSRWIMKKTATETPKTTGTIEASRSVRNFSIACRACGPPARLLLQRHVVEEREAHGRESEVFYLRADGEDAPHAADRHRHGVVHHDLLDRPVDLRALRGIELAHPLVEELVDLSVVVVTVRELCGAKRPVVQLAQHLRVGIRP